MNRMFWARNNPPQCCVVGENPPNALDQGTVVAMVDAAGDSPPHGGQEQDSQTDQGQPPNLQDPGPDDQEGQQQPPANLN